MYFIREYPKTYKKMLPLTISPCRGTNVKSSFQSTWAESPGEVSIRIVAFFVAAFLMVRQ
ncbi:hypothetical protein CLI91_15255 [Lentilactobacillus hilgardii]|uniref:hypothetical protein n=1 Tax=Liquorilactobacillus sp. TaxID=2767923 RepID=UPI001D7560F1|nr:hypothetical protein [Lentilactobacillus hilgardii]MBZ2205608.1 hypothetical protein [Lentilactobacillus hilgardii]